MDNEANTMQPYTIQHETEAPLDTQVFNKELHFIRLVVNSVHMIGGRITNINIACSENMPINVLTTIDYLAPDRIDQ